jgi:hypothetical protein
LRPTRRLRYRRREGFSFEVGEPVSVSRLVAIVRPEGCVLPLSCARPLTKGMPLDTRSANDGAKVTPKASEKPALPNIYDSWDYAVFGYEVVAEKISACRTQE